jgi:type I restriction enzyme S subunit
MKSNYKSIDELVEKVDERNTDEQVSELLGVSIEKCFIKSVANINGTDLSKYKVIRKNDFAVSLMQVSRDAKIPVAMQTEYEVAIMSPAYPIFRVKDKNVILPEYLDMWFKRPEFDREAAFIAVGGVRGSMPWEEFAKMELPVPPIDEQLEVVNSYKAIEDRIALKQKINDNLEATAQAVFQEQFASYYGTDELPNGYSIVTLDSLCTVKGGKRLPADCELLDTPTEHPYIRVRDVGNSRYVCLTDQFQYIDEETHSAISRYIVNTEDIIISIVGTIGLLGKIHSSLNKANLTENCVKLANIHTVTSDYLYYTLCYKKQIKEIELLTVGAVQAKLPMYNIQSMKILVPPTYVIKDFQEKMNVFNSQIEANTIEIQRLYELQVVLLAKLSD